MGCEATIQSRLERMRDESQQVPGACWADAELNWPAGQKQGGQVRNINAVVADQKESGEKEAENEKKAAESKGTRQKRSLLLATTHTYMYVYVRTCSYDQSVIRPPSDSSAKLWSRTSSRATIERS